MERALFLNGVYGDVLEEILEAKKSDPSRVFYLQPYATDAIKELEADSPSPDKPVVLYISTTKELDRICYVAEVIGWEDKRELAAERREWLGGQIRQFQPKEREVYLENPSGGQCVNLLSIRNLRKIANTISATSLIKIKDGTPLKARATAGGWSYVYPVPLLVPEDIGIGVRGEEEFQKEVRESLAGTDEARRGRLARASGKPEKVQTSSYSFRRNPDVVAEVLKRAGGTCELCRREAPFLRGSDGSPYLEVHHWTTLADGGEDTVENAGALCPNCHREAHCGQFREYIQHNRALSRDAKRR